MACARWVAAALGCLALGSPALLPADPVSAAAPPALPFELAGVKPPGWAVLSADDIQHYQAIFTAQKAGNWAAADALIGHLGDTRLLGHVLFQRYMQEDYPARYDELADWLAHYRDEPGADRIYALALRRAGPGETPPAPVPSPGWVSTVDRHGVATCAADRASRPDGPLHRAIATALRDDRPADALAVLNAHQDAFEAVDRDRLRADIAAGFLYAGDLEDARFNAAISAAGSGGRAPRAAWVAGLAAWRLGRYPEAAHFFEGVARADCADSWSRAAGAFWTARAHLRQGHMLQATSFLSIAAQFPRTFYGLLATRVLGIEPRFSFAPPPMTGAHWIALVRRPEALRAIGLLQIGRPDLAERELLHIDIEEVGPLLQQALVALAQQAPVPRVAMIFASRVSPGPGLYYDGALYPLAPWQPAGGYQLDPALVLALMRQESTFDESAVSQAGAVGLMQLMPATAREFAPALGRIASPAELRQPEVNITLGQAYMARLLASTNVAGDVLRLAIAYNAGPGNLATWLARMRYEDDPLLFMESVPLGETRSFAERVLTNLWIYRDRLGQHAPEVDALANGGWPRYVAQGAGEDEGRYAWY